MIKRNKSKVHDELQALPVDRLHQHVIFRMAERICVDSVHFTTGLLQPSTAFPLNHFLLLLEALQIRPWVRKRSNNVRKRMFQVSTTSRANNLSMQEFAISRCLEVLTHFYCNNATLKERQKINMEIYKPYNRIRCKVMKTIFAKIMSWLT